MLRDQVPRSAFRVPSSLKPAAVKPRRVASRPRDSRGFRGFTLIELLVTIAIILVLLGILIGAVGQFSATANMVATKQFESAISTALGAYNRDFGDYPPSKNAQLTGTNFGMTGFASWTGAEVMAQALVGGATADNVTGNGFAQSGSAKHYGPYLQIRNDNTLVARWDANNNSKLDGNEFWSSNQPARTNATILTMASSSARSPFLYYRADPNGKTGDFVTGNTANTTDPIWGLNSKSPRFAFDDNSIWTLDAPSSGKANPAYYWTLNNPDTRAKSDPLRATVPTTPSTAKRSGFVTALRGAPYLLVQAGSDDTFGTDDDVTLP